MFCCGPDPRTAIACERASCDTDSSHGHVAADPSRVHPLQQLGGARGRGVAAHGVSTGCMWMEASWQHYVPYAAVGAHALAWSDSGHLDSTCVSYRRQRRKLLHGCHRGNIGGFAGAHASPPAPSTRCRAGDAEKGQLAELVRFLGTRIVALQAVVDQS